jgi:putative transposase
MPKSLPNVKPGSIAAIVRSYKSAVTNRIRREQDIYTVWQRNYWERVIRDEHEMDTIWRYLESNLLHWIKDDENPHDA